MQNQAQSHTIDLDLEQENNTPQTAPAEQAAPAPAQRPAQRQSLGQTVRRKRLPVPSTWDKVKGFTNEAKARTIETTRPAINKAALVHNASSRQIVDRSHQISERITAEVTGFVAGATKAVTSTVVGTGAGLVTGVRGIVPSQLKRVRMNPEELEIIGSWTGVERIGDAMHLVMSLEKDIEGNVLEQPGEYDAPLSHSSKTEMVLGGQATPVVLLPLFDDREMPVGFLVATEDNHQDVYLWIDGYEQQRS